MRISARPAPKTPAPAGQQNTGGHNGRVNPTPFPARIDPEQHGKELKSQNKTPEELGKFAKQQRYSAEECGIFAHNAEIKFEDLAKFVDEAKPFSEKSAIGSIAWLGRFAKHAELANDIKVLVKFAKSVGIINDIHNSLNISKVIIFAQYAGLDTTEHQVEFAKCIHSDDGSWHRMNAVDLGRFVYEMSIRDNLLPQLVKDFELKECSDLITFATAANFRGAAALGVFIRDVIGSDSMKDAKNVSKFATSLDFARGMNLKGKDLVAYAQTVFTNTKDLGVFVSIAVPTNEKRVEFTILAEFNDVKDAGIFVRNAKLTSEDIVELASCIKFEDAEDLITFASAAGLTDVQHLKACAMYIEINDEYLKKFEAMVRENRNVADTRE